LSGGHWGACLFSPEYVSENVRENSRRHRL